LIPNQLLQDSMFDLIPILADMLGERIGRIKNTKYTLGVGGFEPKGIVPASTVGPTTASAMAITFDEIIDLEHSIDISRRTPDCAYMMHDNIKLAVRKLKDTNSAYIWQPGAPVVYQTGTNMGDPDKLNRYRYWINNDMQSTIAASTKTMLFGQLTQFKIREVGSAVVVVGRELYALSNQTFIVVFERGDSNLLDAGDHPVKHLLQHA
jgi:HK97 family phage major capsid protein